MSSKKLRIIIGIYMMYCFLHSSIMIYLAVMAIPNGPSTVFSITYLIGLPCIGGILLSYHVLTRVYIYEKKDT